MPVGLLVIENFNFGTPISPGIPSAGGPVGASKGGNVPVNAFQMPVPTATPEASPDGC